MKYIEFDVTNKCNLKCNNCTRRCDLWPRNDFIDIPSLERFLDDAAFYPFRRIVIMGGEPTLHPRIELIVDEIKELGRKKHKCTPIIVTNCHDPKSKEFVNSLSDIEVRREYKDKAHKGGALPADFWTMNVAPIDFEEFQDAPFYMGCRQMHRCGYQRSVAGKYYACSMGGPIDEIFDLGVGADTLEELDGHILDQMNAMCRFCGRYRIEYDLGWATFKHRWQKVAFEESKSKWPLRSGKRYLSGSWTKALANIGREIPAG